jgi:hypothetical protein
MLCDRCVLNGKCELLCPGGECEIERSAYDTIISELKSQYGLGGFADEILLGRVAMYVIRVARADVYEAQVGVSSSLVAWGRYVAGLDNMLRVILRELSLTRAVQKSFQRNDVVADVDDLLNTVVKKTGRTPRISRRRSAARLLVRDWKVEKRRLTVFRR